MGPGTALAIRHVPFEDLGSFASVLRERGFAVAYRDAGIDELIVPEWNMGTMARRKDTLDLFIERVAPEFR